MADRGILRLPQGHGFTHLPDVSAGYGGWEDCEADFSIVRATIDNGHFSFHPYFFRQSPAIADTSLQMETVFFTGQQ